MNELQIFKQKEFGQIRSVEINNKVGFVASDIANALGYKNTRDAISKHCKGVYKMNIPTKSGIQNMSIILEPDIMLLIQSSKTVTEEKKNMFIHWLTSCNLISKNIVPIKSRKEIEFIDKLEKFLNYYKISGHRQYPSCNGMYRIDYYIESLKTAIEYDENKHQNYDRIKETVREQDIIEELNCKFIRVNDKYDDYYNLALICDKLNLEKQNDE